jgi:hypothetical protein
MGFWGSALRFADLALENISRGVTIFDFVIILKLLLGPVIGFLVASFFLSSSSSCYQLRAMASTSINCIMNLVNKLLLVV